MSNLKGAILATALFAAVVFPFLLMMSIDTFQQHAFLKMTEEVTEMVKEEGGVSVHVAQVTERLKKKDLTVTFSKPGIVKFGEEIVIRYKYEYPNVRGKKTLDVQDKVVIMKRSKGKDGETSPPIEIAKSYSTKTPESLQPDKEYTFTIPGLKDLMSVTADMGKVEVVRVNGEKVTVKVSGGKVIKTVQTGGTNTLADEKYVTGEDTAEYNQNGYTGTLERYLYSGKLMPADSKVITDTKTSLLSDTFPGSIAYALDGYRGILLKSGDSTRIFSGKYTPSETKWVEGASSANYNQNGFIGTLEKYLLSGEYTPSHTKYVTDQPSANYNSGGYSGTLTRYVAGGTYTPADTKYVTRQTSSYYNSGGYSGSLTAYYEEKPGTWVYGGHVSSIIDPKSTSTRREICQNHRDMGNYIEGFACEVYVLQSGGYDLYYQGYVTKPAVDNRIYRYQGNVTKPAIDTRIYGYRGYVTKPATDTRIYEYVQNYTGTVTRPEMDTRIYKYRGTVKRPASDSRNYEDYYQYELNFQYM